MFGGGMPGMMGMPGAFGGMPGMGGGIPSQMPFGFNPEMIMNMMNNPMVQSMMNEIFSDPEKLKGVFEQNPFLTEMAEGNDELQDLINNPEKLSATMTSDKIKESVSDMQKHLQGMTGEQPSDGAEESTDAPATSGAPTGMPAGFPMGFPPMGFPPMGFPPGMNFGAPTEGGEGGNMFENMMKNFDPNMLNNLMGGFNISGGDGEGEEDHEHNEPQSEPVEDPANADPKIKYKFQLENMAMMGLTDADANIKLLDETNGDVIMAIEKAMQQQK